MGTPNLRPVPCAGCASPAAGLRRYWRNSPVYTVTTSASWSVSTAISASPTSKRLPIPSASPWGEFFAEVEGVECRLGGGASEE